MALHETEPTETVAAAARTAPPRAQASWRAWGRTVAATTLLFLAIWIPRTVTLDLFVTADEADWLQRSVEFTRALGERDWAGTFQFIHPAETTLWAGSIGVLRTLPDFSAAMAATATPGQPLPLLDEWLLEATGIAPLHLLAVTRWWVVLIIALVTTLTFFPLRRLLGDGFAWAALLMIGWSPFMVGFSRELQPDGFLATFYFLSVVAFLAWLYTGLRRRDLVLAGVAMGLAWLTKTPAALLVPAGGLMVGLEVWRQVRTRSAQPGAPSRGSVLRHDPNVRRLVGGYVAWGVVATVLFFALFPAMWLDPLGVLGNIYTVMVEYSGGHTNPNFFMGRAVHDPGPFFYPVAFLFRATPATLIGLAAALVAGLRHATPFDKPTVRRAVGGMLIFALVFFLGMTVIGKKFDRYLLPIFPLLLVTAAGGWLAMATALGHSWRRRRSSATGFVAPAVIVLIVGGALVLLHGVFTARTYPYYINYYNPLLGGNRVAVRTLFYGWGEGLEQVGAWLNGQPEATELHAISWYADGSLSYTFDGEASGVDYGSRINWLDADYLVLYVNQIQRDIPTATAVDYFLRRTPAFTVTLDGIVMARVYDLHALLDKLAEQAPDPDEYDVTHTWPDLQVTHFETLTSTPISSALPVELRFQGKADATRKLSLRLFSGREVLVAQLDVPLADEVEVNLFVPPDAVPGPYQLRMMIYDEETLEPIRTTDGADLVTLIDVEVTAE